MRTSDVVRAMNRLRAKVSGVEEVQPSEIKHGDVLMDDKDIPFEVEEAFVNREGIIFTGEGRRVDVLEGGTVKRVG